MTEPPATPSAGLRRLPGRPGLTDSEVFRAADALLREGVWPTWQRIRDKTGSGSPNTITPMLKRWLAGLAARLDSGPSALHRLPESALPPLETLYFELCEAARRQAGAELAAARKGVDQARSDLAMRAHDVSLREKELVQQLAERTRTLDMVQGQVSAITALLARANADKDSAERRAAALEAELTDVRARITQLLANAVTARRRAARDARPRKPAAPARTPRRSRAGKPPKHARSPARKPTKRKSR